MIGVPFGVTPDGTAVEVFTLHNSRQSRVSVMTYGATIISLSVPDRDGIPGDIVLGLDSLDAYLTQPFYLGAVIGRYANRIRGGRFSLDGTAYRLAVNDGLNHLHGGIRGFDKVVWRPAEFRNDAGERVSFRHTSPDGDEGYPGTLTAEVRYLLTEQDELIVEFEATADAPTPVNLTQHSYFNLAGAGNGDILGHELTIDADSFTPVDDNLIPTGAIVPVAGTALDFRTPRAIGARIGSGYDHNFALRGGRAGRLMHAVRVVEPITGRTLDVSTTEPGLQLYSGDFLDGTIVGRGGSGYGPRSGFTLETQHYPDSPNRPQFPSTILRPGEVYRSRTAFRFGVVTLSEAKRRGSAPSLRSG